MVDCKFDYSQHSPSKLAVRFHVLTKALHQKELFVLSSLKWLSKRISNLVFRIHSFKLDFAFLIALTDKVVLHVDMLAALVYCCIEGKILGTIVIDAYADCIWLCLLSYVGDES